MYKICDLDLAKEPFITSVNKMRVIPSLLFDAQVVSRTTQELSLRHKTILEPSIEIMGIPFNIRHTEERVFLESLQWPSLSAYGQTIREAMSNMLALIWVSIEEYVFVPQSELAQDAIEFRNFLIRKIFV
ncbi:MAG: hypothetical protein HY033_13440 [Ignavibacteriae bacterium]|nr:hypothetical protein [Ignavibacteriota bacterium]